MSDLNGGPERDGGLARKALALLGNVARQTGFRRAQRRIAVNQIAVLG